MYIFFLCKIIMPRIKKLFVTKLCSDKEISTKEGTWYSEDELVHPVITGNIDVTNILDIFD